MQAAGFLIFWFISLFQMAAIMSGLQSWTGMVDIASAIMAAFLTLIPVVGQILGVAGSIHAWGWDWWIAALVFIGGAALAITVGGGWPEIRRAVTSIRIN